MIFFGDKSQWIFPDNGNGNENGIESADVETFKKDPIASLARELCQNSVDARAGDDPVKIDFKSFTMNTSNIPGVNRLKEEIDACRASYEYGSKYYKLFDKMSQTLEDSQIDCLRVSDFNTIGLDGVKDYGRGKAFYYLTKGNGLTTKINANSGGSKGIGKFASFVASNIQTVFYATINDKNEAGFMGITKLASRETNKETEMCSTGYGFYSIPPRIKPVIGKDLILDPDFIRKEKGTDVYIIGFKRSDEWKKELITKVLDSFMCAIQYGDLIISVDEIIINKDTLASIVYDDNLIVESEKKKIVSQYILLNDEFVKTTEVNILGKGNVKILVRDFNKNEEDFSTGSCVMVRYPYMKIKDIKIPFGVPFAAMCIIPKGELNNILKSVENPQHTDWEPKRIEDDDDYRKEVKRIIREMKVAVQEFAKECLKSDDAKEIDIEAAGDFISDTDIGTGEAEEVNKEEISFIELPKVKSKVEFGNNDNSGDQSTVTDIGSFTDDNTGDTSEIPTGNNNGNGGDIHETSTETGYDPNGEEPIKRNVNLTGIKSKIIMLNKASGKYVVTFASNYDENECEFELYYLDDVGTKYSPIIYSCSIDGQQLSVNGNKVSGFRIEKDRKYKFELETDMNDIYACEVDLYAIK